MQRGCAGRSKAVKGSARLSRVVKGCDAPVPLPSVSSGPPLLTTPASVSGSQDVDANRSGGGGGGACIHGPRCCRCKIPKANGCQCDDAEVDALEFRPLLQCTKTEHSNDQPNSKQHCHVSENLRTGQLFGNGPVPSPCLECLSRAVHGRMQHQIRRWVCCCWHHKVPESLLVLAFGCNGWLHAHAI